MDSVRETLGKRLRAERERNQLTQEEFGNKFNLNKQYVSYYETGKREPSIDLLKSFANELRVSVDYLIGSSDSRNIQENLLNETKTFSDSVIKKIVSLPDDLQDFLLHKLLSNDKFYEYVQMLYACITFPSKTLQEWESAFTRGTNNTPETDDIMLRKRWLDNPYISDKSSRLFDNLLKK